MTNYYEEILEEIKENIEIKDYLKAAILIKNELSMPYLPHDFEKELLALSKEVDANLKSHDFKLSDEEIESHLNDDSYHQMIGVNYLAKLNLRDYIEMIDNYLKSDGDSYAKALLIATMSSQGLNESFVIKKGELEIEFIPMYVEDVSIMDGFIDGMAFIKEVFEYNPSMYEMGKDLIIKEAFLKLPLSLDSEEGLLYAKKICLSLFELFGMEEEKETFIKDYLNDFEKKLMDNLVLSE